MTGRPNDSQTSRPNSPAALGHPLQRPALTLWSEARLRAAAAPSRVQKALARRQPQAIALVSLGVWLPTVVGAGILFPGGAAGVAWMVGAAVLYPFLLLLTALGSRLLASSPGAPALELARRVGQAPMAVYEDDARTQLQSPDGPAVILLLRQSERHEVLLRVLLWTGPRGRYERICSRRPDDTADSLATRHNEGVLTPRESDALWDMVTSWNGQAPVQVVDPVANRAGCALKLSVLRAESRTVQRWNVVAPAHQRALELHPAVWMAAFLQRMEETRRAFPDETWETPA